jgi:phage shock protein A
MFGRIWRYIKALFNRKMDQWEDPEILLDQARRDMQEAHMRNRERTIQAITQRNNLQAMVDQEQREIARLDKLAETTVRQGNRDLARQLLREKMSHQQALEGLTGSLDQAKQTVEQIKVAMQKEEETIRTKTADALRLKAQWKQAQIQNSIQKALSGMELEDATGNWGTAAEKIRSAQSEASARVELQGESLTGKIAAMQSAQMDVEADDELQKLEARLGMAQPAAAVAQPQVQVSTGDAGVEDELAKLEQQAGIKPEEKANP